MAAVHANERELVVVRVLVFGDDLADYNAFEPAAGMGKRLDFEGEKASRSARFLARPF